MTFLRVIGMNVMYINKFVEVDNILQLCRIFKIFFSNRTFGDTFDTMRVAKLTPDERCRRK